MAPMISTIPKRTRLLKELPPFRAVAVQIMKMVGDPTVSFARMAELLRTDSVLTGELLRAANSPLFAVRQEITTALQAIVFLGLDMVTGLVATTAIRALVDRSNRRFTYSCWRHSLATALIGQRISGLLGLAPERSYTAGVMHDIGQLALLRVFPDYEELMAQAAERGDDLIAVETHTFGMSHTEAGRWLLSQWGCPLELQNVAALHECPPLEYCRDQDLIVLVYTASNLADMIHMSSFPVAGDRSLDQALAFLPDAHRHVISEDFANLEETVTTAINALEVSLL
jgi:HD-like signal output (HDOD) protein